MIRTPKADDSKSRMNVYSMIFKANYSLTEEYKCLYQDKKRINNVKGYSKFQKRELNNKVKKLLLFTSARWH